MTTPSPDAFDYTDDSVIARVSVDVPSQAITDISQLSTAMGAMRTQLEAIARAQGDWLDYLQQVPAIAERANAAFRDQITQLERMAYIQNELGNSSPGGGGGANIGPQPSLRSSGSPGSGGYSTAAPAGYVNPFQGMPGTGRGGSAGIADAAGQLQELSGDPRMVANMTSARGMAVNPSLLGMVGGALGVMYGQDTGGGQGKGEEDPGSQSPQATQKDRTAAGKPAPNQSGQPVGSEPQREPAPVGDDGSAWQQARDSALDEFKKGVGGSRIGQILGAIGPAGISKAFSKLGSLGGAGAGAGAGAGMLGGGMKLLSRLGLAGLAIGGGVKAYDMVQGIGERVTQMQALGSEEGGDWQTGLKEDIHARMIGLDPLITTDEARKAIQIPMSQGFKGESRDEIRDFLINNFKELGVSMAQSASIAFSSLQGQKLTDKNVLAERSANEATMNVMKELAGSDENGMSFSQRINQLDELMKLLMASGGNADSIRRSALQWQEGFGKDSLALRESGNQIMASTMRSPGMMAMTGARLGVTAVGPDAMQAKLTDMGYSEAEITDMNAADMAKHVPKTYDFYDQVSMFRSLMLDQGVEMDWQAARDLYVKVTSGKSSSERASEVISRQTGKMQSKSQAKNGGGRNPEDAAWVDSHPGYQPSENAQRVGDDFDAAQQRKDLYAPAGQRPRQLPQSLDQIPQRQTINTQGQVTGEVRITVDQQGRVTAPAAIQLSGQQKAVNAGYGSSQLNNAPPGDPTYYHAYTGFGGG